SSLESTMILSARPRASVLSEAGSKPPDTTDLRAARHHLNGINTSKKSSTVAVLRGGHLGRIAGAVPTRQPGLHDERMMPARGWPCSPQRRTERRVNRQSNRAQNRR